MARGARGTVRESTVFHIFKKTKGLRRRRLMNEPFSVAVIVGSLRRASYSRKIAHALMAQAPRSLHCRIVEIGDLPLYNEDLDDRVPASWSRFRKEIGAADAILFVTPEYNRSIPGGLKNAVDVGSRPQGASVFDGLPTGVVSVTPYKLGAFGANHALRQTFAFLNMPVMQQPEAYIGGAGDLFAEDGRLKDEDTATFLAKFMGAFARWIETNRAGAEGDAFGEFMARRDKIARDYVNGEAAPLDESSRITIPRRSFRPAATANRAPRKLRRATGPARRHFRSRAQAISRCFSPARAVVSPSGPASSVPKPAWAIKATRSR
jgi:NAD(P)H-dependent FMN reductase